MMIDSPINLENDADISLSMTQELFDDSDEDGGDFSIKTPKGANFGDKELEESESIMEQLMKKVENETPYRLSVAHIAREREKSIDLIIHNSVEDTALIERRSIYKTLYMLRSKRHTNFSKKAESSLVSHAIKSRAIVRKILAKIFEATEGLQHDEPMDPDLTEEERLERKERMALEIKKKFMTVLAKKITEDTYRAKQIRREKWFKSHEEVLFRDFYPPLENTIVILYTALRLMRQPVIPIDILRWATDGTIPFIEMKQYYPTFLRFYKHVRSPAAVPPLHKFRIKCAVFVNELGLDLPPPNHEMILMRFANQLGISKVFVPMASRLFSWIINPPFLAKTKNFYSILQTIQSSTITTSPPKCYEISAYPNLLMACLVICFKMVYGLASPHELSRSKASLYVCLSLSSLTHHNISRSQTDFEKRSCTRSKRRRGRT